MVEPLEMVIRWYMDIEVLPDSNYDGQVVKIWRKSSEAYPQMVQVALGMIWW